MPFEKGKPRDPRAGRKKGTPNKVRSIEAQCEAYGLDPFDVMIEFLQSEEPILRFQSAKELCQYLAPKKKAIEVAFDPDKSSIKIIIEDYTQSGSQKKT